MSRSTEEGKKEEEKAFKCYFRNSFCPFTYVLIFVCFENIGYQTDKNGHKTLFGFFCFFCFFCVFFVFFLFFSLFFPFLPPFFPFFSLFFFFCFFCFFCFVCFLFFSKNYLYHNKQNKKNKNMLSPPPSVSLNTEVKNKTGICNCET